jgi:hypothetical protein
LADVDTRIILPDGNKWDYDDGSIANSSGVANDPQKIIVKYGGEINVKPSNSIQEHIDEIQKIYDCVGNFDTNYTSNLHIHIGVPGLSSDLDALKRLQCFIHTYQDEVFQKVDPVPPTDPSLKGEEYKAANKRTIRRRKSHHWKVGEKFHGLMMNANSIQEFYEAHAPKLPNGKPHWGAVCRAGINLLQLFNETDTVEFRHFPGTKSVKEIGYCILWCQIFMHCALNTGENPLIYLDKYDFKFPKFKPFNYKIDKIFHLTHFLKQSRTDAIKNINMLLEQGIIKETDLA